MASGQAVKLPTVNKQIIEIKKRIQLSEGQRKALFEEIETERKKNTDEILTLKKEISKLVVELYEVRTSALRTRMPVAQIQKVVGHVGDKTCKEIAKSFDLHLIDRHKHADLLCYWTKNKEILLTKLAKHYQGLLANKLINLPLIKKERTTEKVILELKNKINAVEVQWREAEHIRCRYKDIKRSLLDDAAHFEKRVSNIGEEIINQQVEIDKLQMVNLEACKLRAGARYALVQEEKFVVASGNTREKQAAEGRRLVQERKLELEVLEKSFYQGAKSQIRTDVDEDSPKEMASPTQSTADPTQELVDVFETLKDATGGTGIKEVYKKFLAQRETQTKLSELRNNSEDIKVKLEKNQEKYITDLEQLKFVETKDAETNAEQLEKINVSIVEQKNRKVEIRMKIENTAKVKKDILQKLQSIYVSFNRDGGEEEAFDILKYLNDILDNAMKHLAEEKEQAGVLEISEEKWLPNPYADILRRTPLPQHGSPSPAPPPAASEDEEEVPSRGYLKRQAQLVVDAKTKRKSMRFQAAKPK